MKKIFMICAVLLAAVTAMAQDGTKYYGIKSGSYKTEMDMMGQVITNTVYFDDYGAKQATSMNMMGMEMTQINKDGKMYLVNKGEKSVQEMPQQYTLEMNQMGQTAKATVSVWNGIAMKTNIDAGGFAITTKVVEVKEGPVDAALFEIPTRGFLGRLRIHGSPRSRPSSPRPGERRTRGRCRDRPS